MTQDEKVACRTPAKDRDGVTNIPKWKFDLLREFILTELRAGDFLFSELNTRLAPHLTADIQNELGSIGWHATTVKLELEVRGEIARVDAKGPQILTLGPNAPEGH